MMRVLKSLSIGMVFFLLALHPLLCASEEYHLLLSWGEKGKREGGFLSPCGIAVDKKGMVYVADAGRQCVLKFTSQGKFLMEWKTRYPPSALAVDSEGNVYVGESTHKEVGLVEKFTGEGKLIKQWSYKGGVIGGIAISPRYVYLGVVSFTGSIQKFTKEGVYIKSWGKFDTCCSYLDVAVDSQENVYVAELGAHRVVKCDSEGKVLKKWGKAGKKEGEFCGCCNPVHIALGPDDSVFTSEKDSPRIQKFTPNGRFVTSFGKGKFSEECGHLDIAVYRDGRIFVVDDEIGKVFVFAKR